MMVLTMMIMGIATFGIGLLPTYDSIGVFAPVLLVLCASPKDSASGASGAAPC